MDELDGALRRLVAASVGGRGPLNMSEFVGDPSWLFGLISTNAQVRGQALARHRATLEAAKDANRWMNHIWAQAGTFAPKQPELAARMDQALAGLRHHNGQTIFELVNWRLWDTTPEVREPHAPFAVLYLAWERRHPADWRAPASNYGSPWTRKEDLLRMLAKHGVPDAIRPQLTDLLADVVRHPYRCKDWRYAALVRHLRGSRFDERMRGLLTTADPLVRSRAQFLLHLTAHPHLTIKRTTWARWLASGAVMNSRNDSLPAALDHPE